MAAMRLAAHPQSHLLYHLVRQAAKRFVKRHRSSLHYLCNVFDLNPTDVESIIHNRREPSASLPSDTCIAPNRETAINEYGNLLTKIRIYCDGPDYSSRIHDRVSLAWIKIDKVCIGPHRREMV